MRYISAEVPVEVKYIRTVLFEVTVEFNAQQTQFLVISEVVFPASQLADTDK